MSAPQSSTLQLSRDGFFLSIGMIGAAAVAAVGHAAVSWGYGWFAGPSKSCPVSRKCHVSCPECSVYPNSAVSISST